MTPNLRVALIDDEASARLGLRLRLAAMEDVSVVVEADSAGTGLAAIAAHRPDVIFLDIEMPDVDGFEMLQSLPVSTRPLVVFVTAHEHRALDAFSIEALDYLLKPIDDERLRRAVDRARGRAENAAGHGIPRLLVRDRGMNIPVEVAEIDWIQSDGDYVRLFMGRRTLLHLASMNTLESELPRDQFFRIHREAIINVARVRSTTPITNGDHMVLLTTGVRLRLSRTRRAAFFARLGQ